MKIISVTPEEEAVVAKLRREALKAKAGEASREVVRAEDNEVVFCRATSFESPVLAAAKDWAIGEKTEFMFMPAGVHTICAGFRKGSIELTVKCDENTVQAVQASLDGWRAERPKQECYGCVEHREAEASVRVSASCGFSWRGDGVYLAAEPTKLGVENVNGRIHRSWSPSFTTDADYSKAKDQNGMLVFPEGVRGSRSNPAEITGIDFVLGTITNKPAFREMSPVKAREAGDAVTAGAPLGNKNAAGEHNAWDKTARANNHSDTIAFNRDAKLNAQAQKLHLEAAEAHEGFGGTHEFYEAHKNAKIHHYAMAKAHGEHAVTKATDAASPDSVRAHCRLTLLQDVPDATEAEVAQYEKEVEGGGSHSDAVIKLRSARQNGFKTTGSEKPTIDTIAARHAAVVEAANRIAAERGAAKLTAEDVYERFSVNAEPRQQKPDATPEAILERIYARAGGNR